MRIYLTFYLFLIFVVGRAQNDKANSVDTSITIYKLCFGQYFDTTTIKQDKFTIVPDISFYWDNNNKIYRYLSGGFKSFDDAVARQQFLRDKGFRDAYIIGLKNGRRVR